MHEENWDKFPKIALGDKVRVTWDQTYYDQQEIGETILRESDSQLVVKFNDKEQTEQTPDQLRNNPHIVRTEIYIEPEPNFDELLKKAADGSALIWSRLDENDLEHTKKVADFFKTSPEEITSNILWAKKYLSKKK